jgi:hypothetical protein
VKKSLAFSCLLSQLKEYMKQKQWVKIEETLYPISLGINFKNKV